MIPPPLPSNGCYPVSPTEPYWDLKAAPHFYSKTPTVYSRAKISDVFPVRGIHNPTLANLAKHLPAGAYIAGGYVASTLRCGDFKASDIDIFFNNGDAFDATVKLLQNPPEECWAFQGYNATITQEELDTNSKKIKLVKFTSSVPERLPIQLVKMVWYDSAEHTIDSFDFTATQFAVDGEVLVYNPLAFLDLAKQTLVSHRHHYPADTLFRMVKYVHKGYKLTAASLLKIAEAIKNSEVTDPPMLNRFYDDMKDP